MRWAVEFLEQKIARDFEKDIRNEEDAQRNVVLVAAELQVLVKTLDFGVACTCTLVLFMLRRESRRDVPILARSMCAARYSRARKGTRR